MRKTKHESIVAALVNEPFGTRFYFSKGYEVLKTKDDYGFSARYPMFIVTSPLPPVPPYSNKTRWWGDWDDPRKCTVKLKDKFPEEIKKFGALIRIEHGEDPYRVDPLFT